MENAIYHGIKGRRGPGHIVIKGNLHQGRLHLTIQDDGAGMTKERLEEMPRVAGYAYGESGIVFTRMDGQKLWDAECAGAVTVVIWR